MTGILSPHRGHICSPHPFFANCATAREKRWWRGLRAAIIPRVGSNPITGGSAWASHGYNLVTQRFSTHDGGVVHRGETRGPAMRFDGGPGMIFSIQSGGGSGGGGLPLVPPMTLFGQVYMRAGFSGKLFSTGYLFSGGGYTFQMNYGSANLGLTRWGIADHPTSLIVPTSQESSVALAWDGTTARFMLNRTFENQSIASNTSLAGFGFGCDANFASGSTGIAVFVGYAWDRVLNDDELGELREDPWRVVRSGLVFDSDEDDEAGVAPPANVARRDRVAGIIGG